MEVLFLLLILVGIFGYSFKPPELSSSGFAPIKSASITYTAFGLFTFVDTLSGVISFPLRQLLIMVMVAVGIVGMFHLSKVSSLEANRFKEALLYVSLAYVLCMNGVFPFRSGVEYLTCAVAVAIVVASLYAMYMFKKFDVMPIIDKPELFSIQFMVLAFAGIYGIVNSTLAIAIALGLSVYALRYIVEICIKPSSVACLI